MKIYFNSTCSLTIYIPLDGHNVTLRIWINIEAHIALQEKAVEKTKYMIYKLSRVLD
jgi:hypothetical protein